MVASCVPVRLACVDLMQMVWVYLFFFKQKTAYEMRISDWSSDVCSSDLGECEGVSLAERAMLLPDDGIDLRDHLAQIEVNLIRQALALSEIGRASCRERVCQYV